MAGWLSGSLWAHRTNRGACPRRTGPKGELAPPLGSPPPRAARPAPQAHSGTRPVTDAKKTRSAQTGFLLYAVTGLRSSTHSNGEDAARMALAFLYRENVQGCCRSASYSLRSERREFCGSRGFLFAGMALTFTSSRLTNIRALPELPEHY